MSRLVVLDRFRLLRLVTVLAALAAACLPLVSFARSAQAAVPTGGAFTPVTPVQAFSGSVGAGAQGSPVQVSALPDPVGGDGGVPDSADITAVAVNISVSSAGGGYVLAWPDGQTMPNPGSTVNYWPGATVSNLATVQVGYADHDSDGHQTAYINLFNSGASTATVTIQVTGYYSKSLQSDGTYVAFPSYRLLDTRTATALQPHGTQGGTDSTTVSVVGDGTANHLPSSAASMTAVAINMTAADQTAGGSLTVYPSGAAAVPPANLNYPASGWSDAHFEIVPVDSTGQLKITNNGAGTVDAIVDVVGYYQSNDSSTAERYVPVAATRMLDTRSNFGGTQGLIAPNQSFAFNVDTVPNSGTPPVSSGVPTSAKAVVVNLTATGATDQHGYLTAWTTGATRPYPASAVNYPETGQTLANMVIVQPDTSGNISVWNNDAGGHVQVIADVVGYFATNDAPALPTNTNAKYLNMTTPQLSQSVTAGAQALTTKFYVRKFGATAYDVFGGVGSPVVPPGQTKTVIYVVTKQLVPGDEYNWWTQSCTATNSCTVGPAYQFLVDPQLGAGGQSWFGFDTHQLTKELTLKVNEANGNLLLQDNELSLPGPTGSLQFGLTYNSLRLTPGAGNNGSGLLGVGWRTATAPDYRVINTAGSATVYLPNGGIAGFLPIGTNGDYQTPSGLDATLKHDLTPDTWTLTYHSSGEKVSFNSGGRETSDKNREGAGFTVNYGGGTNPTTIISDAGPNGGYQVSFAYNGTGGRLSALTQTAGSTTRSVSYGYDSANRLTQITLSQTGDSTRVETFGYDYANRLTQITDANGKITTISYGNNLGDPQEEMSAYQVSAVNRDSGGLPAVTRYDYASNEIDVIDADNHTSTKYHSDNGGDLISSVYDAFGQKVHDKTYNADNQTLSDTNGMGGVTSNQFGANPIDAGNTNGSGESLTSSSDADGAQTSLGYTGAKGSCSGDGANATVYQPICSSDASGNTTDYTYAGPGNLSASSEHSSGDQAKLSYNDGNSGTTYSGGSWTDSDPNDGTVATSTTPNNVGSTTSSTATRCGRDNTKEANNNCTRFDYTNHQLTNITLPTVTPASGSDAPAAITLTYDGFGRLASRSHQIRVNGSATTVTESFAYNALDQITAETFSDSSHPIYFNYDGDGNTTVRSDANATTSYYYDAVNELTARITSAPPSGTNQPTRASNPCPGSPSDSALCYGYDKVGNLTSAADGGGTTAYHYNKANLLDAMQEPGSDGTPSGHVSVFRYNTDHKRIDTWNDATTCAGTSTCYTPTYGNGSDAAYTVGAPTGFKVHVHSSLSNSGRLNQLTAYRLSDTSGNRVQDLSYGYTITSGQISNCTADSGQTSGHVTHQRQTMTDNLTSVTTTYCYDHRSRLSWTSPDGGATHPYNYTADKNGNLTAGSLGSHSYNAADQLTDTNVKYDGDANLIANPTFSSLGYTPLDQTSQITPASTGTSDPFTYTGDNQNERATGDSLAFTNGKSGVASQSTGGLLPTNSYFERTPDGGLVAQRVMSGSPLSQSAEYYYVTDGLGSITHLIEDDSNSSGTDAGSYTYDPYGNLLNGGSLTSAATGNPYRYTGTYYDSPTGLYKMGARYYDPSIGRFTQQDAIVHLGDLQQGNLYEYAGADPINGVDPQGMSFWSDALDVVSGVAALGAVALAPLGLPAIGLAAFSGAALGGAVYLNTGNAGDAALAGVVGFASGLTGIAAGGYVGVGIGIFGFSLGNLISCGESGSC
ncbi:MAG: RHS repeat-associated core domain-containing protein [Actinomycetes bacterium]